MDGINWRTAQAQGQPQAGNAAAPVPAPANGDWRAQLQQESRQSIVNMMTETLKRHLPFSGPEGHLELRKIAVRFEKNIHAAAVSQSDYLRRISLKMLSMEPKSPTPMANSLQSDNTTSTQNNWKTAQAQGQAPVGNAAAPAPAPANGAVETGDWRAQLQQESRQSIVNKIMESLKRHLSFSGAEGHHELRKIAVRMEEKIYAAAVNQSDYLRKISLKMLSLETKSPTPMANSLQSNNTTSTQNPQLPGTHMVMHSQVNSQGQPLSIPMVANQSSSRHQLVSQNIQNNMTSSGPVETGDWRAQLQQESRQLIVNMITETLKRYLTFTGPEGLHELRKIAVRFEEKFYAAAVSQSDYLRKISLKMLSMETKSPTPMAYSLQSNNTTTIQNPQFPDSTAQTGNANGADWQEDAYQKIKSMKDMYFMDLNDLHGKISGKLALCESLPQQPPIDQVTKLKNYKSMVERLLHVLQLNKSDIQPQHKEKIGPIEKQIHYFLNSNRPCGKPMQQGQPQSHMQPQAYDNNPQMQYVNIQGSMAAMQQNSLTTMQHSPLSSVSAVSGSQQNMINTLQHGTGVDLVQGSSLSSLPTVATGSLQQNPVSGSQQMNISSLSSQSGANLSTLQPNSNMLQHQHPKQHEQQMLHNQQMRHKIQQQQLLHKRLLMQQQQQQLLHKQQLMQQQQQQLLHKQQLMQQQQQIKQSQGPLAAHQMQQQLHQMAASNDMKMRQQIGMKSESLDSTAQTGNANGADWQEEAYQKIKSMKDMYFMDLNDLQGKISGKLAQWESLAEQPSIDHVNKLKNYENMVERLLQILQLNKSDIQLQHKEKMDAIEKQIHYFLKL